MFLLDVQFNCAATEHNQVHLGILLAHFVLWVRLYFVSYEVLLYVHSLFPIVNSKLMHMN